MITPSPGLRATLFRKRERVLEVAEGRMLIVFAEVVYFILDWRLGAAMLVVSIAFYFVGALLPMWINIVLFVAGWIFQFVGHSVYEKRQPAFLKNALHLLVGPLWILNDLILVVTTSSAPGRAR